MAGDDTQIIWNTLRAATPWDVFMAAGSTIKLCMTVSLLAFVAALVLAMVRRTTGARRFGALDVIGIVGLVAGIAGAAYTALITWFVAQYSEVTHFAVILPEVVEAAYALLYGVLVWLVARIGNAGA